MTDACIIGAVRTPVGRHGGALAGVRPDDLAAQALAALVERTGVAAEDVEEVVLGAANQAGEDNRNVARMAALLAGFPVAVPGVTVNRLCASGLEAIGDAARRIKVGEAQVCVAGGVESMSRAPWVLGKSSRAFPRGDATLHDTTIGWRFVNPRMRERYGVDAMGETAENVAEEYGIARAAQDRFALRSHQKAVAAADAGRFDEEIVGVTPPKGEQVRADEGPRRDASLESLAELRPAFREGGSVTAGNSSSLNDGAAAVLLTSGEYARAHGLTPLARVRTCVSAGVAPRVMGVGPVPATRKALALSGLSLADVGLIELNEAFAAQALAVLRDWEVDPDDERLNVNGGAIALGHPLGGSGARIVTTLLHELRRRPDVEHALVTMCVGVGQGVAMVLERCA